MADWSPNEGFQHDYLASSAYEVLGGGRRGTGKSEAALVDPLRYIGHPAFAGIAFRETYPELEQLIERSFRFYQGKRKGSWNGTSRTWRFPSGASIKFRHLKDSNAYRQYLGHEYHWMLFEELTSFEERVYLQLTGSCRSSVPGLPAAVRATTNPGGRGHAWVKARFVDVCPPGQVYTDPATGLTRQYIPGTMAPQILRHDPDYVRRLMALPDAERRAWLDGDWDAFSGSVFKLETGIHVWTWKQFKDRTGQDRPPAEWNRFQTYDAGFAKPFSSHWLAVDFNGRAYAYREWYGVARDSRGNVRANEGLRMEHSRIAERMADLDRGEAIGVRWTGPDLFSAGTGDTTAGIARSEYYARAGIHFSAWDAGPDSRKAKKAAVHERLAYERDADGNLAEWPGLILIVDGNDPMTCHQALRTIPALEYDPAKGGEDIDTTMEDHAYDDLGAFCLMRPWRPQVTPERPRWVQNMAGGGVGMVG